MVKKRVKGTMYGLAALSVLFQTAGAFAQMPPFAFKGFSKHYIKKAYDLVIGDASLEGGFPYDLLLFGNFKPAYDANKKRVYSKDSSNDPLWNMTKFLFPSPAGQLTTERALNTNFGKHATPKTVALLQNFANSLRTGEPVDENQVMLTILDSFNKDFKKKKDPGFLALHKSIQDLQETELTIPKLTSLFKVERKLRSVWTQVSKDITTIIIINTKDKTSAAKKQEIATIIDLYLNKDMVNETLKPLLTSLKQSIEKEKDSLYLPYMTEQVISSFFCAKFNTQGDIREYMENLDDRIVDKTNLPKTDDYLKLDDLPGIATKVEAYDLDEFYDLAQAGIFNSLTPYKDGVLLLSNGNAYPYDRKQNKLSTTESTFADCAEMGARHIMNILLYDNLNRKFDLSFLKKSIKPENPYFKNFEEFYEAQTLPFANAGDIDTRSKWNKVVGDLNALDTSNPINYKGSNVLNPGFINFVRVFEKIFGLTMDALPTTDLKAKKDWLENSLNTLFNTVNTTKTYKFNLSDVKELHNDLSGDIDITVSDKNTKDDLFSFLFYSEPNAHSYIKNLKTLKKSPSKDYNNDLKTHSTTLHQGTTEEALWMVTPANVRDSKLSYPLYKLFNKQLADNDSKIDFLKSIEINFKEWKKEFLSTPEQLQSFKVILANVLDDIPWEDEWILLKVSPMIMALTQEIELQDTLYEKVKGLKFENFEQFKKSSGLYKNLEFLDLKRTHFPDGIFDSEGLTHLKRLDLGSTNLKRIEGLKRLANLKELYLADTKDLEELNLEWFSQLTKLNLDDSAIKGSALKGLNSLTKLQLLDLSRTNNLEEVNLEDLSQLTTLYLTRSPIKGAGLKGLNSLANLKKLYLSYTQNLEELNLQGLSQLTELDLKHSAIKGSALTGFNFLTNLKELNLSYTKNLEEVNLEGLSQLTQVNLTGSAIKNLALKGLHSLANLQELNLVGTKNLEEVNLESLSHLTTLYLRGSKVKKASFGAGLTILKDLDLFVVNTIEELEFKEDMKDLKINLKCSGIKNRTQIKGIEHLDEKNITWYK